MESELSVLSLTASSDQNVVNHVQNDILRKSMEIEDFIRFERGREGDACYNALTSLYVMFKSELSVNLSLRRILVNQRKTLESIIGDTDRFFACLEGLGFEGVESFGKAVNIMKRQAVQVRKLKKLTRRLGERNGEVETVLECALTEDAERCVQIASLTAQLDASKGEVTRLSAELASCSDERRGRECDESETTALHARVFELERGRRIMSHELEIQLNRVKELERERIHVNESGNEHARITQEFESERKRMNAIVRELREKVKTVEERIETLKVSHRNSMAQAKVKYRMKLTEVLQKQQESEEVENRGYITMKLTLESIICEIRENQCRRISQLEDAHACEMACVQARHEKEVVDLKTSAVIQDQRLKTLQCGREEAVARAAALDSRLRENCALFEEQERQIATLNESVTDFEKNRDRESESERNGRQQCRRLVKKIVDLRAELTRITDSHEAEIGRARDEYKARENDVLSSNEAKIEKMKTVERELKLEVKQRRVENRKLVEQLREYSYMLEQREGVLTKLQFRTEHGSEMSSHV